MVIVDSRQKPAVTIILATYNRPEALRCAVETVLFQTFSDWHLLVIGDHCNKDTSMLMEEFTSDSRITYVNLSQRTGSQSLPNSVGMKLANSPIIAFLNHDDLWLPDHLEVALHSLENGSGNFFLGSSIFIGGVKQHDDSIRITTRMAVSSDRTLPQCYSSYLIFEPASSWVVNRELALKIGPWRSPFDIYRFPSQDWLMRAWRSGAILMTDPRITCIKMESHWVNSKEKMYESTVSDNQLLLSFMKQMKSTDFRALLESSIAKKNQTNSTVPVKNLTLARIKSQIRKRILKIRIFRYLYFRFGFDIDDLLYKLAGSKKGKSWRALLQKRTSENDLNPPQLEEVLKDILKQTGRHANS